MSVEPKPRNPNLIQVLTDLRLEFEVVSGSTPELAKSYRRSDIKRNRHLTDTERACTLGHRLMMLRALECDFEWSIFLEDDAVLNSELLLEFSAHLHKLPRELILLGACGGIARRKTRMKIGDFSIYLGVGDSVTGAHAYLLHRSCLAEMIQGTDGLPFLADSFNRRRLELLVVSPYVATQLIEAESTILRGGGPLPTPVRKIFSAAKADFVDRLTMNRWGGRLWRLDELNSLTKRFFHILPGCRDTDIHELGSRTQP